MHTHLFLKKKTTNTNLFKDFVKDLIKFWFSTKWYSFKNYEKYFFILSKNLFVQDIQIVVFLPSPIFFPVSHYFRGSMRKNLQVYDVFNSLHRNLITYFVWYLEKEIRCDIETSSLDKLLNMEHSLWKNHAENVKQK